MKSKTPRTDALEYELISKVRPAKVVDAADCRKLECELIAVTRAMESCEQIITQLQIERDKLKATRAAGLTAGVERNETKE